MSCIKQHICLDFIEFLSKSWDRVLILNLNSYLSSESCLFQAVDGLNKSDNFEVVVGDGVNITADDRISLIAADNCRYKRIKNEELSLSFGEQYCGNFTVINLFQSFKFYTEIHLWCRQFFDWLDTCLWAVYTWTVDGENKKFLSGSGTKITKVSPWV